MTGSWTGTKPIITATKRDGPKGCDGQSECRSFTAMQEFHAWIGSGIIHAEWSIVATPQKDPEAIQAQLFYADRVSDLEGLPHMILQNRVRKGKDVIAGEGKMEDQSYLCFLISANKPRHLLSWMIEQKADVNWKRQSTGTSCPG